MSLSRTDSTAAVRAHLREAARRGYVAAYRLLGDADQAREACQEAAARALGAAHRYDPTRPFYPWYHRILKNHCLDRLRERRRIGDPPGEESVAATAESGLLCDERSRAVAAAIERLPEDLRELIELRHFQELSYAQMAAALRVPQGTVMSRLYRARARLRALLLRDAAFRGRRP